LKYQDKPVGSFVDKKKEQSELTPVDVIIFTLDEETFLEKCLFSIYREIPVRKLLVNDGGSTDATLKILEKFPRTEVHVRPDFKTTGKGFEFMISLVETDWFILLDAHNELEEGWYDGMMSHKDNYDVLENSRRVTAYHSFNLNENKLEEFSRSADMCHLIKKSAVGNYHCDDDYMWRFVDIFFRQIVENSNFKYKKIDSVSHTHNEVVGVKYESDPKKSFKKLVWKDPELVIIDKNRERLDNIQRAKAIIKYLDPDHPTVIDTKYLDEYLRFVDRKWVEENGPKWIKRHQRASSWNFVLKRFVWKKIIKPRTGEETQKWIKKKAKN